MVDPAISLADAELLAAQVSATAHALNASSAAILRVAGNEIVIEHATGSLDLGGWFQPAWIVRQSDPVVSDRCLPGDRFAETLERHGISFFAASRLPSTNGIYLCAFDAERRPLSRAQSYVLQTFAASCDAQRELEHLRHERHAVVARTASREERLRLLESVVVNANDSVLITEAQPVSEPGPRILYANEAFTRTTGYELHEILGKTPRILQGPDSSDAARARLRAALLAWEPVEVEIVNYRKDGTAFIVELSIVPVADETGWFTHWVSVQRDITDRKAVEEQYVRTRVAEAQNEVLAYRAFHDELTGLRNRAYFMDRLAQTIDRVQRPNASRAALLFFDLDRFKVVNDSLGHGTGDLLLVELGRRLATCVRGVDLLARMGGDEFTILVEHVRDPAEVTRVADRVLETLQAPIRLDGQDVYASASIGIAFIDDRYIRAEDVLRDADSAMYRAKRDGGTRYAFFDESMHATAVASLQMQMDLRRAVDRGEFVVHYQPIVDSRSREIAGVEALVRWQHPERGLVPPNSFIPLAEETGLIRPIGAFVLREACRHMSAWHERFPGLTLNVNVSPRQIFDAGFVRELLAILKDTGIPPHVLQLEITESLFLERAEFVGTLLQSIRALGVRIALDDFGTGYSSLSYLERFRLDTIKIDRSFTERMTATVGSAIVKTIVDLAFALDMKVVVEGVETNEQLQALRACECEFSQGFLFSRPVAHAQLEALFGDAL
ncbi:MAG: EAL domain-containing protein [Vulcanimicrobiaceae bacterium]